MKSSAVLTLLSKAARPGPLPYLIVAAAILGVGVVLQMQATTTQNLPGGGSLFGLAAQLGGAVGLFGLLTLALRGAGQDHAPEADPLPVTHPVSAFAARLTARPATAPSAGASLRAATLAAAAPATSSGRLLARVLRR